jgi:hypothetical protein
MTTLSIQSNSCISRCEQSDNACPATPTSASPSKTHQITPNKSPNKDSKHAKELKTLTTVVQALAQKLKKRDKQMRQMQEKANRFNEVALRLESTNKSIADVAAENQTLSRRVSNLEANIDSQDVEESDEFRTEAVPEITDCTHGSKNRIDEAEFRQLEIQRTFAVFKVTEKEVALAESRAESEELRCQLSALTALLPHQSCGSVMVPESPRSTVSPVKSMKFLSRLLKSPKKAPNSMPIL